MAAVPTCFDLHRVMTWVNWHLDRLLPFDRCDVVAVEHDVEGTTPKLDT